MVEETDLEKRIKEFNAEFIPLIGKYKLGLGAQALITPDGKVGAQPVLFDDVKKEEVKTEEPKTVSPA